MPLYEYQCRKCSKHFEQLLRGDDAPHCPDCQSVEVEKQLSVFAVNTKASAPAPAGGCGNCPQAEVGGCRLS